VRWKARYQDYSAQHNVWVIEKIERVLGQDINESCVREFDSGLETIDPSELYAFHAVALVYEKAATFLVSDKLSP
jgi:hypothetical protein